MTTHLVVLAVLVIVCGTTVATPPHVWPCLKNNFAWDGSSSVPFPPTSNWSVEIHQNVVYTDWTPAIDSLGRIIVVSSSRDTSIVFAMALNSSGSVVWDVTLDAATNVTNPVIDYRDVFFVATCNTNGISCNVFAVSSGDGTVLWKSRYAAFDIEQGGLALATGDRLLVHV